MDYIKIDDTDPKTSCYHFSRIANRESIKRLGLKSVEDGENATMEDHENSAIYFMYGKDAILENFDAWIRWEYNRDLWKEQHREQLDENIDEEIMKKTYERVYEGFKNRNYYKLDLIEGENPETSDYSLNAEDIKKRLMYEGYKKALKLYEQKKINFKPEYPY